MDFAEIGQPCADQEFLVDSSNTDVNNEDDIGCANLVQGSNCDACTDIDQNQSGDTNLFISP